MLKATRSIKITANSMINGTQAMYMSADLATDGKVTSSTSIQNVDLYEANKTECRADLAEFQQMVYDLEDQGTQEDIRNRQNRSTQQKWRIMQNENHKQTGKGFYLWRRKQWPFQKTARSEDGYAISRNII